MINNANDIGFIHDIASLDKLRQNAVNGEEGDQKAALHAAAKQFESIFTSMLFKSMRDANSTFESDLMNSQDQEFYRQMLDEQMASELSSTGSLGLADMIVAQLSSGTDIDDSERVMRNEAFNTTLRLPVDESKVVQSTPKQVEAVSEPTTFDSPEHFVQSLKPYADKAAQALGVDPSILIAQAALETGWGSKVITNSQGSSNNLFNIKADRSWKGDKVATQTLEYHENVPVKQKAAFRSYASFEESFNDFVRFLNQNPRYHTALAKASNAQSDNSASFIRGIHKAGYATDPNYADKVLRVKERIDQM